MNIEQKVNMIMGYIAAENQEEKEKVLEKIRNMMVEDKDENDEPNADKEIEKILFELGLPEHLKGYRYSICAIRTAIENPGILVTRELYPAIAEKYSTTPSKVERAIRNAIETAWCRCDIGLVEKYFGNTVSPAKGKPTNAEFIFRISNIVKWRI